MQAAAIPDWKIDVPFFEGISRGSHNSGYEPQARPPRWDSPPRRRAGAAGTRGGDERGLRSLSLGRLRKFAADAGRTQRSQEKGAVL